MRCNLSAARFFAAVAVCAGIFGRASVCDAQAADGPELEAAVVPPVGTVSREELKTCAVEIRAQLRLQGYRLAIQKEVRESLSRAGVAGKPSSGQLAAAATMLGAEIVMVSVISGDAAKGHFLDMAAQNARTGNIRAVRAKLPARGAAPFGAKQLLPAVAACTAALLDARPNPMHGPFPAVTPLSSSRLIRKEPAVGMNTGKTVAGASAAASSRAPKKAAAVSARSAGPSVGTGSAEGNRGGAGTGSVRKPASPSSSASSKSPEATPVVEGAAPQAGPPDPAAAAETDDSVRTNGAAGGEADPDDANKKKIDWKRWDHAGIFGELGFMFSWCNRDGMCATTSKGYGARLRLGVRIASYVSLSFAATAVDHQMPITTDTEVFLNVDQAFVYAGIFGGLRVHPVRRFPVDPYVGVDLGYSWLLYAQNTPVEVETDPNIPPEYAEQLAELINVRRETIYLRGFTVAPEIGVNIFVAPPLAFGVHVQWILPYWKDACSRVYNPSVQGLETAPQICAPTASAASVEGYDEGTVSLLATEDNLPRFVSLELDLTFVFK